jgi:hypothetical protein
MPCSPTLRWKLRLRRRLQLCRSSLLCLFLEKGGALLLDLFDIARRGLNGEFARQQIVASVACFDSDNLAARAQIIYVFAQEDLCICHLFILL